MSKPNEGQGSSGNGSNKGDKSGASTGFSAHSFAVALLNRLGIQPSAGAVHGIVAWEAAEGGNWENDARYNPMNTTEKMPGSGDVGTQGDIGSYTSWQQGLEATAKTLENGNYGGILEAFKSGNAESVANAVVSSPWGTKHIDVNADYTAYGHGAGASGDGGGGVDDAGVPSESLSPHSVKEGLDEMGFASALIHSNKSLTQAFNEIVNKQIDVGTSAGQAQAKSILENSAWFQNHNKSQREFDQQKFADPANWKQSIQQQKDAIKQQAEQEGVHLSGDAEHIAKMVLRNGLTPDEVSNVLAKHYTYNPNETSTGTAGQTVQSVQQLAQQYYTPISNGQIQKYTRQVLAGNLDPSTLSATFQKQAISMAPYLKAQIESGQTVADIMDPYKQMMATTLELDPDGIKNEDPSIMKALQSKDANGNLGLMPLYQFQQQLYNDPRWLNTDNAKQSLVSTTGDILQKMGLIS